MRPTLALVKLLLLLLHCPNTALAFVLPPSNGKGPLTSTSIIVNEDIGAVSQVGLDPHRPQKVNQDAFCCASFLLPKKKKNDDDDDDEQPMVTRKRTKMGMACVMDGHGKKGHLLTKHLAEQWPPLLQEKLELQQTGTHPDPDADPAVTKFEHQMETLAHFSWKEPDPNHPSQQHHCQYDIHKALQTAFHQIHVTAMQNPNVPAGGAAGTTCIVCLWDTNNNKMDDDDDGWIHVAHVGDSRIHRFDFILHDDDDDDSDDDDGNSNDSDWTCCHSQPLSTPTTVNEMPLERARIEQCMGQREPVKVNGSSSTGSNKNNRGPATTTTGVRIDQQGNVWYGPVAIAMTRALGDCVMLRAGVVPTPIVESFPLQQYDSEDDETSSSRQQRRRTTLVLATDGLWDVVSAEQVETVLVEHYNSQGHFSVSSCCSAQQAAQALTTLAEAGWKRGTQDLPFADEDKMDDITCLVVQLDLESRGG